MLFSNKFEHIFGLIGYFFKINIFNILEPYVAKRSCVRHVNCKNTLESIVTPRKFLQGVI